MTTAPVMLRRYQADSYAAALDAYETDLAAMAESGWLPVAQSWGWDSAADQVGWFLGGSSWRPGPGTLAVTYRQEAGPTS